MSGTPGEDRKARLAAAASGSVLLPQPPKRILAATDLSARSDRALARAVQLAQQHKAQLTVLHVVDEELPELVQTRLAAAAETEIEACLDKLGVRTGAEVTVCVLSGRDYQDILKAAEADACNLIVLGRHRDETADRPLRGTTMERVIRQGVHPILVVADRADGPYRTVIVGVDFSIFSRFAVRAALALAPDASFRVVHAFQTPFEGFLPGRDTHRQIAAQHGDALARLMDEELESLVGAESVGPAQAQRIERILRSGEVTSVLRSEAASAEPDLLVIGTHGRVGLAHAVLGSVAESLLNRPPCDVLAVKAW
jgi:nucleotide-binding universal stress UspA family protein